MRINTSKMPCAIMNRDVWWNQKDFDKNSYTIVDKLVKIIDLIDEIKFSLSLKTMTQAQKIFSL